MIVALASTTFMVVSTHFVYFQSYRRDDLVTVDTSRIAAAVVSGIGFLAGGAILRTGLTVQGLTTAAGLWLVAAIGLAAGGGMYGESVFVTAVGLVALTVFRRLENKEDDVLHRKISLVVRGAPAPVAAILSRLRELGSTVSEAKYDKRVAEGRVSVSFDVRMPADLGTEQLVEALEAQPGVRRVRIEPMP